MPTNIFLAPCDSPNFEETVSSPVELLAFPDHPAALTGSGPVRFWGVREGAQNRRYFEKMQPDDLVLFYQDGTYIGAGWIGTTFEDDAEWASATFWRDAPATLIYTIEDFHSIAVPKAAVNRVFGYVETYNPEGLIRVADDRVTWTPKAIEQALQRYTETHR